MEIKADRTLEYYKQNAKEYADRTSLISLNHAYSYLERFLPKNAKILDFGCGSGRDARYFLSRGFQVTPLDGSAELAEIASSGLGIPVIVSKFEEINFYNEYDGVWASASLLHLNDSKLELVLEKLMASLVKDGILYASFKYGNGEEIDRNGRFFKYQTFSSITVIFERAGFEILLIEKIDSHHQPQAQWLYVIAKKSPHNNL